MTVHNEAIAVGSAEPVLVSGAATTGQAVWIQNDADGGAGTVTFGGPDVVYGEGPKLAGGLDAGIDLQRASDDLYAICDTGETATLLVLRVAE